MLGPRDTATRERKSLDGLWRFAPDGSRAGRRDGCWRGPLAAARDMPVPASDNDIVPDAGVHDHGPADAYSLPVGIRRSEDRVAPR